jgi:hypothetical protein
LQTYNLKEINIASTFGILPIIFLIQGFFSSLLTFFLFPIKFITYFSFSIKILSCIIFTFFYITIMMISTMIAVCTYNFISKKFNKYIVILLDKHIEQ